MVCQLETGAKEKVISQSYKHQEGSIEDCLGSQATPGVHQQRARDMAQGVKGPP